MLNQNYRHYSFTLLLSSILLLFTIINITSAAFLTQTVTPESCSPAQYNLYAKTYELHIQEMGLTVPVDQMKQVKCKKVVTKTKSSADIVLLIKDLDLQGPNSNKCPLIVLYDPHKKLSTIKNREQDVDGLEMSCNSFISLEEKEETKTRVMNVINQRIFEMLQTGFNWKYGELSEFYRTDLMDFSKVFEFKALKKVYLTFIEEQSFFQEYLSEYVTETFLTNYSTYFKEFVNIMKTQINANEENTKIHKSISYGSSFTAAQIWKDQMPYINMLNSYTINLTGINLSAMAKLASKCCSYNVKNLNEFMKNFYKIVFTDPEQPKTERKFKLKEDAKSMKVLLGELKSIPGEVVHYYIEEKLISQGVNLIYKQGKINWIYTLLFHGSDSCDLDADNQKKFILKAETVNILPKSDSQTFTYCSQLCSGQRGSRFYSVLFEIDFMADDHHTYCEIVFEKTSTGEVLLLPRTDSRYRYYLPCDNQENPNRFKLI